MLALALVLALAQSPQPDHPALRRAIDLYETVELKRAKKELEKLVSNRKLKPEQRVLAYQYLAATHFALGDEAAAQRTLEALAKIAPTAEMDPRSFDPKLIDLQQRVLARARTERAMEDPIAVAEEEHRRRAEAQPAASGDAPPAGAVADTGTSAEQLTAPPLAEGGASASTPNSTSADSGSNEASSAGPAAAENAPDGPATETRTLVASAVDPVAAPAAAPDAELDRPTASTTPLPGRRYAGFGLIALAAAPAYYGGFNLVARQTTLRQRDGSAPDAQAFYDPYVNQFTTRTVIGFGAMAALAGAGAVLVALDGADASAPGTDSAVSFSATAAPNAAAVFVSGRFAP